MSNPLNIDAALVKKLIASQFPEWAAMPLRPVNPQGWDNRTFRLGDNLTVRLPSADRYAAQVEKEQRWLPVLSQYLPLAIPVPVGIGKPADEYPFSWSILEWIEGDTLSATGTNNLKSIADAAAQFLTALHLADTTDGPIAGEHNFFRGGNLAVYDAETRSALAALAHEIDVNRATEVWQEALNSEWRKPRVWVHGDFAPSNLLVRNGALTGVIDFGGCGVGDPACDLVIAWTLFDDESRQVFHDRLDLDDPTWARARGWTLWKALLILTDQSEQKTSERPASEVLNLLLEIH
jgi:aminoglycoside phosphotransferase (APT) family kinase protein